MGPEESQECGARGSKCDNPGAWAEGKKKEVDLEPTSLVVAMQNGDGVVDRRGWGSGASGSTRTDEAEKIWGRGWQVVLLSSKDTVMSRGRKKPGHSRKRGERGKETGFGAQE